MKNDKLNGKVAVVTGASKGIGAGIAKEFGEAGAAVIVNYVSSKTDADKVVNEITKRGGKLWQFKAASPRRRTLRDCSLKRRKRSGRSTS